MKTVVSTITSKGQITIPAELRRHLGVGSGDKVSFVIDDAGHVEVKATPYPTVASLRKRSRPLDRELTPQEMREIAYEDRLLEKYRGSAKE